MSKAFEKSPAMAIVLLVGFCLLKPETILAEMNIIIMENIEVSWNILIDINFKIFQSKYFN